MYVFILLLDSESPTLVEILIERTFRACICTANVQAKTCYQGCRGLNISPFFLYGLAFLYPCLCLAIFGLHEVPKKRALRWTLMPALFCTTWASRVAAASKFTLHFCLCLWLCQRDMLTFRISFLLVIYVLRSLAFRVLYDVRGYGVCGQACGYLS